MLVLCTPSGSLSLRRIARWACFAADVVDPLLAEPRRVQQAEPRPRRRT